MRGFKSTGFAALLCGMLPGLAAASPVAGAPYGPIFTADTTEDFQLVRPTIAANAAGGTVVAWYAYDSPNGVGHVRLRRFSAVGVPFSEEVAIGDGIAPQVAMSAAGRFAVTYNDPDLAMRYSVFGGDGAILIDGALVPEGGATSANIAMDADGNFVIAFLTAGGPPPVAVRRFNPNGQPLGSTIPVATPQGGVGDPAVGMASNGRFVVAYRESLSGSDTGAMVRVFDASGAPVTAAFRADQLGVGEGPKVAMDGNGNFVVAWLREGQHLRARFFNANGTPQSDEIEVATDAADHLRFFDVAMSANGETVFVWDNGFGGQPPATSDVFARRYDKNHTARDANPVKVNSGTLSPRQVLPSVALDADGDFVVVWQNGEAFTAGPNIKAQRFVGPEDVDLSLTIADTPDPVATSGALTYTFSVSNNHAAVTPIAGASAGIARVNEAIGSSHNVELTAVLPTGATEVQGTGTQWTCTFTAPQEHCVYQDLLLPGQSSPVMITLKAPATNTAAQTTGSVQEYQLDTHPANDSETETTTVGTPGLPTVQFHQTAESRNEDAGAIDIALDLSAISSQDVTVTFTVGGTATTTPDYTLTPASHTLTIPAGQTHASIVVAPVDDSVDESNETVILTLTQATHATLGTNVTNTLTIVDDDTSEVTPTVQLAQATSQAAESAGTTTVTVQLSSATSHEVTVPFSVGGSATSGSDYATSTASPLVIPAGETSRTITITLVDDSATDSGETVVITLGSPTGATLGAPATQTITIVDNDGCGGVGSSHVTIDSAAAGKEVTFTTDCGTFSAISVVDAPANPPAGLEYPLGFFAFAISGVPNNAVTTLTIEVPEDSNISDLIDCVENSCYRYPQDASPDPGQARIVGDVITVKIQDNGPGDNDPRPGFIGSKVAPARVPDDDGGSATWLLLVPMFGAAMLRRRPSIRPRAGYLG